MALAVSVVSFHLGLHTAGHLNRKRGLFGDNLVSGAGAISAHGGGLPMSWYPEIAELLRALTVAVAMVLVVAGTIMLLHSFQSQRAALHAVMFFGIAAGLGWVATRRGKYR